MKSSSANLIVTLTGGAGLLFIAESVARTLPVALLPFPAVDGLLFYIQISLLWK